MNGIAKPISLKINSLENKTLIYSIRKGLIFSGFVSMVLILFLITSYIFRIFIKFWEFFGWLHIKSDLFNSLIGVLSLVGIVIISFLIGTIVVYLYRVIEFWILWNFSDKYRNESLNSLPKKYDKKIKIFLESSRKFKSSFRRYKYGSKNKKNYKNKK